MRAHVDVRERAALVAEEPVAAAAKERGVEAGGAGAGHAVEEAALKGGDVA